MCLQGKVVLFVYLWRHHLEADINMMEKQILKVRRKLHENYDQRPCDFLRRHFKIQFLAALAKTRFYGAANPGYQGDAKTVNNVIQPRYYKWPYQVCAMFD
jgi:hypothetical protein